MHLGERVPPRSHTGCRVMARSTRSSVVPTLGVLLVVLGGATAAHFYAQPSTQGVSPTAVASVLADRLGASDSTLAPLRTVYHARAGQPVWMNPAARDAALDLLRRADRDGLPLDPETAGLLPPVATDTSLAEADLRLTAAVLRFGEALSRPRADAAALYGRRWTPNPPSPPDVPARLARALTEADVPSALIAWADALRPPHPEYHALRAALTRELALAEHGLRLDTDLAQGDSSEAVVTLRARLAVEAGQQPEAPSPEASVFDPALFNALRAVQRRLGVEPSGRLDEATRTRLNARRPDLVPRYVLNLERWRWLPHDLGDLHVWVDIPTFELAVRERDSGNWSEAVRFRTVVGSRGWETPVFSDTMETVVFNPTWTVPASIQREQYGRVRGHVVVPPGPRNAMGRVKFMFPNRHAVYIHDTPAKWAFGRDQRARSHGCVRAGDPEALATTLLPRTTDWTASEVSAMFRGPWRLRNVTLDRPVPVHLVYFTVHVEDGSPVVVPDVYDRDGPLAAALGLDLVDLEPGAEAELIADEI